MWESKLTWGIVCAETAPKNLQLFTPFFFTFYNNYTENQNIFQILRHGKFHGTAAVCVQKIRSTINTIKS